MWMRKFFIDEVLLECALLKPPRQNPFHIFIVYKANVGKIVHHS